MLAVNEAQKQAFVEFEKVVIKSIDKFSDSQLGTIIDQMFGTKDIKIFGMFNFNPSKYVRQSKDKALEKPKNWLYTKVDKLEELIYPAMLEDGKIDGTKLNDIFKSKKPHLYTFVNIPNDIFNLASMADKLALAFVK